MPDDWTLPAILTGDATDAAALLRSYFDRRLSDRVTPYFSGAMFERLGGGGDRGETRNFITTADLVAVSMLGVTVPAHAELRLLGSGAEEVTRLLADIPVDLELADAEGEHIAPDSPAWRLWSLIHGMHGMGDTTTSKLLARKRPRLIPVQDRVVIQALGHDPRRHGDFWSACQRQLQPSHPSGLNGYLRQVKDLSGVGDDISLLRVLDIVVWLSAHGQVR